MPRFVNILLTLGALLATLPTAAQFTVSTFNRADTLRGALGPARACYDVTFYDLDVRVEPQRRYLSGTNKIHFRATADFSVLQIDLFENLSIDQITFEETPVRYRREGDAVFVRLPTRVRQGDTGVLRVAYYGQPTVAANAPWDGGFVWQTDAQGQPWVGVACEGTGASLWWPNKDHLSDEPDSMAISCEVPAYLTAVANGQLRRTALVDSGRYRRFEWFVSYPINNYNVTLNVADYAHWQERYENDSVGYDLDYYVLHDNLKPAKKHFKQVKPMLAAYEKLFGPYPFPRDGYALVETPYWGMEHQSAIAYGNNYRNNDFGFDFIIVHESGHEYWGNSVSVADHAEMWIHEAFCTYAEALYLEETQGYETAVRYLRTQRKRIKNQEPILGPLDVNYHYWEDADMYYKGTWMLHTLRHVVADDSLWFGLIRGLATTYRHRTVATAEVIGWFEEGTGLELDAFFEQYLRQAQPPRFVYELTEAPDVTLLRYRWEATPNFRIPFRVRANGDDWYTLQPTTDWQTLPLPPGVKRKDLTGDTDTFYVLMEPAR